MLWFVFFGMLAAFGALCAIPVIGSLLHPKPALLMLICTGSTDKQVLACIKRHRLLYELGLLKCQLIIMDSKLPATQQQQLQKKHPYLSFYTRAQLAARFQGENDHAGNGDLTGHHHSGGISKL